MSEIVIEGVIKKGLRIASGLSKNPKKGSRGLVLNNTIFLQKPFFEKAGIPNIIRMHNGTINIDISPKKFKILEKDHEVTCEWLPDVKETFWFVKGVVEFKDSKYEGYMYYPCPSPIKSHQDNVVEVLTEKIPDLNYGDSLIFRTSNNKVQLY